MIIKATAYGYLAIREFAKATQPKATVFTSPERDSARSRLTVAVGRTSAGIFRVAPAGTIADPQGKRSVICERITHNCPD